jgi:prophage regulatory protein
MNKRKILTAEEVCELVRYSRRHLYRLIAQRSFPAPIVLGAKKIGWVETEVLDWLSSRPRRQSPPATEVTHA